MSARCTLRALLADRRGAGAVEFAFVAPLLIILLLGVIDGGRFLWEVNRSEKATQMGARYAIVTDVIPSAIVNATYVGSSYCQRANGTAYTCTAGDPINDPAALGTVSCKVGGCTCVSGNCPSATIPAASFTKLVTQMQAMKGGIGADNVEVIFRGSGIGFAGDPNKMEVVPLVTVQLNNMTFKPLFMFHVASIAMPKFSTTLTAESSSGQLSN